MQVPSPESFTHESGYWVGPPCSAPVPGADFDLHVPDWEGDPDPLALEYAERVLPQVYELRAKAAEHIKGAVQVRWIPDLDPEKAQIVSLFCEGGSQTVVLELNWETDLYNLWSVRFIALQPVEFGCRSWGGSYAPWRGITRPLANG